jgi:tRNA U38,U39,U40 pseudouridine synthase TruA
MRLKELKKIVINELIQEYVGYDMFSNDGRAEEADSPDIHSIVSMAVQKKEQHVASYMNSMQAEYAEIVRKIAPLLIGAGVGGQEAETFLEEFLTKAKELVIASAPNPEEGEPNV